MRGVLKLHGGTDPQVRADLDENLPPFLYDADQIHRVLVNLVKNAIEASPRDSTVRLELLDHPDHIELAILDRGPGIPEEIADRIFEPFFTTKAPGAGTGLGLPISYRIVSAHGGSLRAENRPGGGARFVVELPHATA